MNLLYANPYAFSPGESVGPHVSRSSLRLVCLSGRGLLDVPDGGWKLQPGMVVGLPMACPRWYRAADKDPFVLIGIHVGQANEPLDHPSVARWPVTGAIPTSGWLKHDHAGHATHAAQRLADVFGEPASVRRTRLLTALLAVFNEECERLRELPAGAGPLIEIAAWMTANFARELTRSDLAQRAGLPESTFAAAFTALHGRPPGQFLIAARIRAALALLTDTNVSIPEVARRCGFFDVPHFARTFRQWQGMTATDWRQRGRVSL